MAVCCPFGDLNAEAIEAFGDAQGVGDVSCGPGAAGVGVQEGRNPVAALYAVVGVAGGGAGRRFSMPAGGFGGGGGSWMPMAMAVIGVLAAGRHSPGGREA